MSLVSVIFPLQILGGKWVEKFTDRVLTSGTFLEEALFTSHCKLTSPHLPPFTAFAYILSDHYVTPTSTRY